MLHSNEDRIMTMLNCAMLNMCTRMCMHAHTHKTHTQMSPKNLTGMFKEEKKIKIDALKPQEEV